MKESNQYKEKDPGLTDSVSQDVDMLKVEAGGGPCPQPEPSHNAQLSASTVQREGAQVTSYGRNNYHIAWNNYNFKKTLC